MAENVYVLNTGVDIPDDFAPTPTGSFNVKTSTNPRIVTEDANDSDVLGIYSYEIHTDEASAMGSGAVTGSLINRLFPLGASSSDITKYATNLFENPGYRITIDTGTAGVTLATDRDYFVLIYADNLLKHHIAKITEKQEYEGDIFNFDFEPALPENISAGTKVAIYQGPYNINKAGTGADNVVAVAYGLLNDTATSEERHDKYVEASRPTFYFYDGKTALDHDRKYTVLKTSTNAASGTPLKSVFVTDSPTSGYILDKSIFTQNANLVDNNKLNDRLLNGSNAATPRGINSGSAQGSLYTFDHTTWATSSKNYDDSDGGLKTYISYIDSPLRTQSLSTPYQLTTKKTITNKGNMFEAKYYDTERMLEKKINENESIQIKELIGSKEIIDEPTAQLPGTYDRVATNAFRGEGLDSGVDLRRLLGSSAPYEPILIDGVYYIISSIGAPLDGDQTISVTHKRAIASTAYESVGTLSTDLLGKKAFRKVWSPLTLNYLIGHDIDTTLLNDGSGDITRNGKDLVVTPATVFQTTRHALDSDIHGLEYVYEGRYYGYNAKVITGDKPNGFTSLDFEPESSYYSNSHILNSLKGNLLVYRTIFEGKIESTETKVEQGQFKYEITGRDVIGDLLNTAVNTNYTYSDEFVYSTMNPFNENYTDIGRNVSSISGAVVTADGAPNVVFGDVLYLKGTHGSSVDSYYLLGVVKSVSGNDITLVKDCYIRKHTTFVGDTTLTTDIYKARRSVLAGKTLETSLRNTDRATTLIGSADKGAVFTTGKYFDYGTAYVDNGKLNTITSRTIEGCTFSNSSTTITTPTNGTADLIAGMLVRGTGIPDKATIVSITNTTTFTLSANTTSASATGGNSLIFGDLNGFEINNLITTISDDTNYTDSPIAFDFHYNTISSMVDFPVLSEVDTKDGLTQFEIGYVSPIVVGRIETDNLLDTFIESSGTAQASRKNNSIYLINGQGMPLGGFLHLLGGEVNTDKSPKTFNNDFEEDPTLNATVNSQYALRFNTPIWRYVNKCFGRLTRNLATKITSANTSYPFHYNDYYEKVSNYHFYASGYKASVGRIPTGDEHKDDTDVDKPYRVELPTERTGLLPAVGSRSYDITRYPDNFNTSENHYGRRLEIDGDGISMVDRYKATYELYDNNSGPLHIFSIGDIYPESKKNPNNIGFTEGTYSRSIADYGVVFKGQPKGAEVVLSHTNWSGVSTIKNRLNDDYFYQPIESSKGDLKRMNLVRLTDVTYDMMMNEVDYENYKFDNFGGPKTHQIISEQLTKNSHIIKSFTESGFSPIDITLTSNISDGTTIAVNDDGWFNSAYIFTLYTDPFNSYSANSAHNDSDYGVPLLIGQVASVSSNTITIPAMGPLHPVVGYTSGSKLYVTVKLAAENANTNTLSISGNTREQFPIIKVTEVDNDDGMMNHNYNRTMALVNVGDGTSGNAAFEDGDGDTVSEENRFPLNVDTTATAGTLHDVNGIVKLPYIPDSVTEGSHFNGNDGLDTTTGTNTHMFRWNFDANFNGAVMTITNGKALDFFQSSGVGKMWFHSNTMDIGATTTSQVFSLTVGSDSSYNQVTLRLTNVTNTALTFVTDTGSTSPGWSDSDETNCVLTIKGHSTTVTKTAQRLFPIRAIQDSKHGGAFTFKNMNMVLMDSPLYSGNTGSINFETGVSSKITGAIYNHEVQSIDHFNIQVGGIKHNDTNYDVDGLEVLVHGDNTGGATKGVLETNINGTDFAGVRPIEVLFKPFIDVSDFTVTTHSSDASLKTTEKILSTNMKVDVLDKNASSGTNEWLCYSNNLTGYYLYGNDKLHKVISHTVAKDSTTFKHYLKIDNASSTPSGNLSLMKINQTCTYDYSPKEIQLNKPTPTYTKKPGHLTMNGIVPSHIIMHRGYPKQLEFYASFLPRGGINSLYTVIQPDGGGGDYLIPRSTSDVSLTNSFSSGNNFSVYITDGINSLNTSLSVANNNILTFNDMKEMKGTPSIGSIFTITTNQNPDFKPESISICAPFKVVREAEEIADDILSKVGLPYNKSDNTDKYYLAANYTGENALTATNNALSFKGLKLKTAGQDIIITSDEDEKDYRDIVFDEDNDKYSIVSIKKDKTLYDRFNKVILYGDGVRGFASNYRDIKKRNREYVKEIYDYSIIDSKQADEKAIKLLKLFTNLQEAIEIEVGNRIPFLESGQIVTVSFPTEGISTGEYVVIEVNREMGYPVKILLGQYNRDLANTFSMLLSETRNLQGRSKQKVYTSVTSPNVDIQAMKVKLVRASITKTTQATASSGSTLGLTKGLGLDSGMGL
tara:strand:+ start:2113 stop:8973 length:6861 start_codon:yes stop_codon:yes gene_type:complete